MIFRPLNLFGFLAAATAGLHLYQTKHEVALLDRELHGLVRQAEETQGRTMALNAEWAWLNEPDRMRGVAQRHLGLDPMQPSQFVRLQELERRLPAAVPYAGPATLFSGKEPRPSAGPIDIALLPRNPAAAVPPPADAPAKAKLPGMLALRPPEPSPPPLSPVADMAPLAASPDTPSLIPRLPGVIKGAQAQPLRSIELPAEPALPRGLPPRYGTGRGNGAFVQRAAPVSPPAVVMKPVPRHTPPPMSSPMVARPVPSLAAPAVRPVAPPTQIADVAMAPPRAVPPALGGSALGGRGSLPPPVPYGGTTAPR